MTRRPSISVKKKKKCFGIGTDGYSIVTVAP